MNRLGEGCGGLAELRYQVSCCYSDFGCSYEGRMECHFLPWRSFP
jgi:hypothetical protein